MSSSTKPRAEKHPASRDDVPRSRVADRLLALSVPVAVVSASVLVFAGLYLSFFVAPTEAVMGLVQKIFYFHVPVAWITFMSVIVGGAASVAYLVTRSDGADRLALAAIEIAALFGVMVLVTGPIWASRAWGAPWVWDVRLTTFLVVQLVLFSYLLVRAHGGPAARPLASGIAILGVAQIPLVYFAVDLWRGPHPPRMVKEGGLQPEMLEALLICTAGFVFLYLALLQVRVGMLRAASRLDALHLLESDVSETRRQ